MSNWYNIFNHKMAQNTSSYPYEKNPFSLSKREVEQLMHDANRDVADKVAVNSVGSLSERDLGSIMQGGEDTVNDMFDEFIKIKASWSGGIIQIYIKTPDPAKEDHITLYLNDMGVDDETELANYLHGAVYGMIVQFVSDMHIQYSTDDIQGAIDDFYSGVRPSDLSSKETPEYEAEMPQEAPQEPAKAKKPWYHEYLKQELEHQRIQDKTFEEKLIEETKGDKLEQQLREWEAKGYISRRPRR